MTATVHGMPRIGANRELKWALESTWAGEGRLEELDEVAAGIRRQNWSTLVRAGVGLVPVNDFSLYDHVLDTVMTLGALPQRFAPHQGKWDLAAYFAMARGSAEGVPPLGLTKWFDTNYHYLVPELGPGTSFQPCLTKLLREVEEARSAGAGALKAVLVGPFSLISLSRPEEPGFDPWRLLEPLAQAYGQVLEGLAKAGVTWAQLDEPALVMDRTAEELAAFEKAYRGLSELGQRPKLVVSTYFGAAGEAMGALAGLPVEGLGLDLCAGPANLDLLEAAGGARAKTVFAGVVDGRNVWATDFGRARQLLERASGLAQDVVVSSSCSLMHVPVRVTGDAGIPSWLAPWLAFAEEKVHEVVTLARGLSQGWAAVAEALQANRELTMSRRSDARCYDPVVRRRMANLAAGGGRRRGSPAERRTAQQAALGLPVLPTTTIGSFPQTRELRAARAALRAGELDQQAYEARLRAEVDRVVSLQEELGLDVLVHGEPERDDMVRYFAAQMPGFALPEAGWVQSYGSRCVRPPVLYGDVWRPRPMSVEWWSYAASRTARPMKAVVTGPLTMLRWSFVRDDQPTEVTATQLALAISDEVADLQEAGARIVQVDEPGLPEGLPLRRRERDQYLSWATGAFRLAVACAEAGTQVHTHMCYADFSGIVEALAGMDVDVVSFEAARSRMQSAAAFASAQFEGGLGPGVYDVHSPYVPASSELYELLAKAVRKLGPCRVWANPDCGLKTRKYEEVVPALQHLVEAARRLRAEQPDLQASPGAPATG